MEVIPAIDLLGGKCVRLVQGDYDQQRIFDNDPVAVAARWTNAGATRLHVVDLDGARDGVRANAAAVRAVVESAGVPVQLGGGIRTASDAEELCELGVDRVIFGTAAVSAPGEVEAAVKLLGAERVMVGVDARDGKVQTRGWTETSELTAEALMLDMVDRGVRRFMCTDTSRDGTLSHPNFQSITSLIASVGYPIVAAGGIASIDDLLKLARIGAEGAVTGLAIYSGALDLERAIREVASIAANAD
ncbi:MAG: 1-(5-phosphoribosyl)-5-[(5-phosphoribosylamino)methylideneamino]imidazole-4-carboxamide isomerase [Chloroflexi bacterium]|nr:1-(5-phosphoribosyl)-5-[(5-phosphoribosylamino)methylideneamino]imidazole-4-carboxamide isomerase [Chloroflexota bacterium]